MKVTVDGQVYDYDANRLLVSEAMEIQEKTGLNLARWQAGLQESDPRAIKALVYMLKQRAGENPDWPTLDFDLAGLQIDDQAEPAGPKEDAPAA